MKSVRAVLPAIFAIALGGSFDPAHAAWPNDPGVNVHIAPSASGQFGFSTVEDGEGGAFFTWSEASRVYAQHLTAQGLGAPGWPAGGIVVSGSYGARYAVSAVSDGAGGFIVLFNDYASGPDPDVYAQRVSADGALLWGADGAPVCTETGTQYGTSLCSDRTGGAVFVWQDDRNSGASGVDVYAQRLSSSGSPVWDPAGVPLCTEAGDQDWGRVVSDGTIGGSFFCWRDPRSGTDTDLYASRLDRYGNLRSGWTLNGSPVCLAAGAPALPAMIPDGAFGAFIAWVDPRSGSYDVYVMRMDAYGAAAPGWAADGVALTSDAYYQYYPALASDGAGGAVVAWGDSRLSASDIYAQRISSAGVPLWTAGGVPLTSATGEQYSPVVVADGAGGAVVGWQDTRGGHPPLVFAQRVTGAGAIAPGFGADGNAIATGHWVQELSACTDGSGGAILTWQDAVAGQGFTQRIDRWGYLGAEPRIASVKDVPNDQGGRVKVSWDRSPIDAYPENAIASYLVYRSVPTLEALGALGRGEAVIGDAGGAEAAGVFASRRTLLASRFAGATLYWEHLGTVAAGQLAGYSYLAATAQDSVPGSNPRTLFMVRAQNSTGDRFWLSDPDSGYSTDDLAPAAPAPFTGAYSAGATHLHWGANAEADFAHYRLYRGATPDFVPGPESRIASPPDTGYADQGAAGSYYKLTAVDAHGNESAASLLTPMGTVDAPASPVTWTLGLARAFPNPSAGVTTCRFTLPSEGPVRVTVHDAAGRLVQVLLDARMPAGEHAVRWEAGRGAGGRVPSGLYFAKLEFGGRVLTTKVARVE